MLLKAILTTVVLSSSTVAMAQTHQASPYHNDDAYYRSIELRRGHVSRRQAVLAASVTLAANHQASFIKIDPRFRVSRLRLELQSGRTYVESVFVKHVDGTQDVVRVNKIISPRTPSLVIDMPTHDIVGVAINSSQMRAARGGGYRRMGAAKVRVIGVRW
jgi:hypothetical protein